MLETVVLKGGRCAYRQVWGLYISKDVEKRWKNIVNVDIALLSAKTQGQNRVEYYDGMEAHLPRATADWIWKNMRTAAACYMHGI